MMKVFVTGVCGQLGYDVMNMLVNQGYEAIGSDIFEKESIELPFKYIQLDITDSASVQKVVNSISPSVVIHCAAWTAVDDAEDEKNHDKVYAVNVLGTENIVEACLQNNSKLVYISTDYVFNGQGNTPWKPDDKSYAPLNYYGNTKMYAEKAIIHKMEKFFIIRTSWAFGYHGNNFVKTMLNIGKKYNTIRVVNDQIGSPTYTADLAKLLIEMMLTDKYGIYHATNEGNYISWYEFTCEIFRQAKYNTKVIPVSSLEYGLSKAKRPPNSRLDKSKLVKNGFNKLPDWQDALQRYLKGVGY